MSTKSEKHILIEQNLFRKRSVPLTVFFPPLRNCVFVQNIALRDFRIEDLHYIHDITSHLNTLAIVLINY